MFGAMRAPAYARINPRHETPAFVTDEGAVLTETMAIGAWLEARDTDRRISFDPRSRAADRMHRLMAFVNTGFTGAFGQLWTALEMEPPTQAALRDLGASEVVERHDRLEEMIGDGPFLLGERPNLVDALLIGVARWLDIHAVANGACWPRWWAPTT